MTEKDIVILKEKLQLSLLAVLLSLPAHFTHQSVKVRVQSNEYRVQDQNLHFAFCQSKTSITTRNNNILGPRLSWNKD